MNRAEVYPAHSQRLRAACIRPGNLRSTSPHGDSNKSCARRWGCGAGCAQPTIPTPRARARCCAPGHTCQRKTLCAIALHPRRRLGVQNGPAWRIREHCSPDVGGSIHLSFAHPIADRLRTPNPMRSAPLRIAAHSVPGLGPRIDHHLHGPILQLLRILRWRPCHGKHPSQQGNSPGHAGVDNPSPAGGETRVSGFPKHLAVGEPRVHLP